MYADELLFKQWLESKGRSPKTIEEYLRYFKSFVLYAEFNQRTIDEFMRLKNNNVAGAFIRNFRTFYKLNPILAQEHGHNLIGMDSVVVPHLKVKRKKSVIPLELHEVMAIEKEMPDEMLKLMLLVSFNAGARVGTLSIITVQDLLQALERWFKNREGLGHIFVRSKGEEIISLNILPETMSRLESWFRKQGFTQGMLEQRVWRIGTRRWRTILDQAALRALGRTVNPHLLRHSVATYLIDQGEDILTVKEHLSHKSIISSQTYTHMAKKRLEKNLLGAFRNQVFQTNSQTNQH